MIAVQVMGDDLSDIRMREFAPRPRCRAICFLNKPFDGPTIIECIERALSARDQSHEVVRPRRWVFCGTNGLNRCRPSRSESSKSADRW
jgi:hypothetical protein